MCHKWCIYPHQTINILFVSTRHSQIFLSFFSIIIYLYVCSCFLLFFFSFYFFCFHSLTFNFKHDIQFFKFSKALTIYSNWLKDKIISTTTSKHFRFKINYAIIYRKYIRLSFSVSFLEFRRMINQFFVVTILNKYIESCCGILR